MPPRRDATQKAIDRLKAIVDPRSTSGREELTDVLAHEAGLAVEKAAQIVASAGLEDMANHLAEAFRRLSDRAAQVDPSCHGKLAIVTALVDLGVPAEDVLVAASAWRQPEPPFGDTAAGLRGMAIVALANCGSERAVEMATYLLVDEGDATSPRRRAGPMRQRLARGPSAAALQDPARRLRGRGHGRMPARPPGAGPRQSVARGVLPARRR